MRLSDPVLLLRVVSEQTAPGTALRRRLQIGSVNMQFTPLNPLMRQVSLQGIGDAGFGLIGARQPHRPDQPAIQIMHEAALQADLDPDRLSFTNALSLIRDAIPEFQQTARHQLPRLYQRLLLDILAHRLPARSNRSNPRVVKRKMSKFHRKRPEHSVWPQPSKPFRQTIVILN